MFSLKFSRAEIIILKIFMALNGFAQRINFVICKRIPLCGWVFS